MTNKTLVINVQFDAHAHDEDQYSDDNFVLPEEHEIYGKLSDNLFEDVLFDPDEGDGGLLRDIMEYLTRYTPEKVIIITTGKCHYICDELLLPYFNIGVEHYQFDRTNGIVPIDIHQTYMSLISPSLLGEFDIKNSYIRNSGMLERYGPGINLYKLNRVTNYTFCGGVDQANSITAYLTKHLYIFINPDNEIDMRVKEEKEYKVLANKVHIVECRSFKEVMDYIDSMSERSVGM